ncbi:unnamed protein product [Clavelina lepadiformis]|uniref:Fatty acid hydroxylase domain-containing protein n=1 Tax=Clavelina lepadiformis TaxID=159417 RepID=A0ABP0H4K8_CLALP
MEFLSTARSFFELQWSKVLDMFDNDEKSVFVVGTSMVLFLSFCAINSFFMVLDLSGKPKFLHRYKIQKDKNIPVDASRYIQCCRVSLTNEILSCLMIWLLYPIMRESGMSCQNRLPPIWRLPIDFYAFLIVVEIMFYYSHRFFHLPWIYKYIHKKHHEWIAPISLAASYAHPVEHLVSNFFPLIVGPILMGSHLSIVWIWLAMSQISTCLNHSDYHFPFQSSPQFHDYHHIKFNECYGVTGWLDNFHKTSVQFKESIYCKRHVTFYGLTPITERFPSKHKKEN